MLGVGVDRRGAPPPVTIARGLARVAGLAQRAKVSFIVTAAVFKWDDVVHLSYRGEYPLLLAVFTQRVGRDIAGADGTPCPAVAAVDLRVTLVSAVTLLFSLGVLGAEACGGEFRAARV